jgi:predicted SAM-dependent methyltransferase
VPSGEGVIKLNYVPPTKLHVGCWHRKIPGWVHVDICDEPHIDHRTEAHNLSMIPDDSCGIVYASHVLEYYDWQEAKELVLPEWYRVLKPRGILRLSVPDMATISRLYQARMPLSWFIGPMFGRMEINGEMIYHKCIYDRAKLTEILNDCGFEDCSLYDWKETEHAEIDDHSKGYIPHMRDDGILLSLNLECHKPWR